MSAHFERPQPGAPTAVRFPPLSRDQLGNGLNVLVIRQSSVPMTTAILIVHAGTAHDPETLPGLASLTADLLDEGAGQLDAIALADALAQRGSHVAVEAGTDAIHLTLTSLSRELEPSLSIVADIVARPHMGSDALERVRELRLNRLRQFSRSPQSAADRAFAGVVFRGHPYGHGALGTSASLAAMTLDDARRFWIRHGGPANATLVVAGDLAASEVIAIAKRAFGSWASEAQPSSPAPTTLPPADARLFLVDRPGAPQSELRLGHLGPARRTGAYHALVTLNAILGGQFTSRINRNLREEKAITYGAQSSFDFRRAAGAFSVDASVQSDATAMAVQEVLRECERIREPGDVLIGELARGQASLTRGYVRNFETAAQLARAAAQLVIYGLPHDAFDTFVPSIEAIDVDSLTGAARDHLHPAEASIVVVGDAGQLRSSLEAIGREIVPTAPEF